VLATGILTKEEKLRLKEVIEKSIGKKVEVIATFRYRL
jgi:F0F1-type ATP synthase delta subunit